MQRQILLPMLLTVLTLFYSRHALAQDCTHAAFFQNTTWESYNLETKFTTTLSKVPLLV